MAEEHPKTFGYSAFIDEVRELLAATSNLPFGKDAYADPNFREWKLKVTENLRRITAIGYDVTLNIRKRHFAPLGYGTSLEFIQTYQMDMQDTQAEMRMLVEAFERYGPPAKRQSAKDTSSEEFVALQMELGEERANVANLKKQVDELTAQAKRDAEALSKPGFTDKMTIPWLWHNLAASTIWAGAGVVVAAFVLGTGFGGWPSVQTAISNVGRSAASAPAALAASAPALVQASVPAISKSASTP